MKKKKANTKSVYDLLFMSVINQMIFFFSQGTIKDDSNQSNSKTSAQRSSDNNDK